jgi:hypothetical protein
MRNTHPTESPLNGGNILKIHLLGGVPLYGGEGAIIFNFFVAYPWKRIEKIG